MAEITNLRTAYCHPDSVTIDPDWIKNLLLFFDKVCILLPDIYRKEFFERIGWLAEPLVDEGVLRLLRPEDVVNDAVTTDLAVLVHSLLDAGAFSGKYNFNYLNSLGDQIPSVSEIRRARERLEAYDLDNPETFSKDHFWNFSEFLEDYYSRYTSPYDFRLVTRRIGREEFRETKLLLERLHDEGLIFPSGRKGEAHIDRVARAAILALLPLVIRAHSSNYGLSGIVPVTDHRELYTALSRTLDLPPFRRAGDILQAHMRAISLDTSGASLDDVLSFRDEHQPIFLKYMRTVEDVARRIGAMEPPERIVALAEHEEEVAEAVDGLRTAAGHWGRPFGGLVLGLTGAAWTAIHGADPVGGTLAGLGALIGFSTPGHADTEFSYLFEVERAFKRRPPRRATPLILVDKKSRPRGSSQAPDYGDFIRDYGE